MKTPFSNASPPSPAPPLTAPGNSLRYRADIDGLRAVAVLVVLFFHAEIGFTGGYVGVDVFFVISGFLITGLILKDLERGRFQLVEFWERRARRILPVLSVVVLACLIAGWRFFFPGDFRELGQSVVAQTMLASNLYFWRESGYFEQNAELKPLLHTWSLAVEEQFYLLFPLLLLALQRIARESIRPAIVLVGLLSFGLSIRFSYTDTSFNFYLLPTRAWELLIGAFLAVTPVRRASSRWRLEALSYGGILAILYASLFYDRETRFPGLAAVLPCGGAAVLIWANSQTLTSVGRFLATPPIVFVGLISYSLYLWHWPMLVFSKYSTLEPLALSHRVLVLLASVALAAASWRLVETPFRKRSVFKSRRQIFGFAALSTAVLLVSGLAIHRFHGIPARMPAEALQYAAARSDLTFRNQVSLQAARDGEFVELGAGDREGPIALLVWGDSHAMATMPVVDLLCREHAIRGVAATHSASAPLVGYEGRIADSLLKDSMAYADAIIAFVRTKQVRDVLLIARWESYVKSDGGTERLRSAMVATVDSLHEAGARVWILRQVPRHRWDVPRALAITVLRGGNPDELGSTLAEHEVEFRRQDPIFLGVAARHPDVFVLDPTGYFVSAAGLCRVSDAGHALYRDDDHLTVSGALRLRELLEPIFAGIDDRAQAPAGGVPRSGSRAEPSSGRP